MARMFERMQQAYRFTRRPPEFLLTHPLSESRISDAKPSSPLRGSQSLDPDLALDYQIARIRAQQNYSDNPAFDIANFRKSLTQAPEDLAMKYGLALALSRADQHDEALQYAQELYKRNPQSVLYIGAYAELLINAARTAEANELLGRALTFYPDSYPLSMLYAQALIVDQEYAGAERIYKQISRQRPLDPLVWFELAETSGLAGNVVDVHLARAEFFYLNGAPHRAIQHLEYAKNLVAGGNRQLHAKLISAFKIYAQKSAQLGASGLERRAFDPAGVWPAGPTPDPHESRIYCDTRHRSTRDLML